MAKTSRKKKKVSATDRVLSTFQHDTFSVFFLLSVSTLLGSVLYLMQFSA